MTEPRKNFEANDMPESTQSVSPESLSRWGDEGGTVPLPEDAGKAAVPTPTTPDPAAETAPELTNAELVQLRVRVIALENLLVAILSDGSESTLARVRAMAHHITPRAGQTPHKLTTSAASHMLSLLHRAEQWDGQTD